MSATSTRISAQSCLLAKTETTTNTAESLGDSDGAFTVFNLTCDYDVKVTEREGQNSLDPLASAVGGRLGKFTFETELYNSGTTLNPSWATTLLPACGLSGSAGTYSLLTGSATAPTVTMAAYEDGGKRFISGASGTFTLKYVNGEPVRVAWEFQGVVNDEADVSLPAPSFPYSIMPPVFGDTGTSVSMFGATPVITDLTITLGNTLTPREDANNAGVFYRGVVITARKPTWEATIESPLVATTAWYTKLKSMTLDSLNVAIGSGSHNVVTFNSTKAQVTKKDRANRNGILCDALGGIFTRASAAGDDALTLVLS